MTEKGIVTPQKPGSHIADEFRAIKRPILMNIDQQGASIVQNANLIMVTSALPGEGKTFSAINLAMSLASEQDRTVLLVDADVTKANAALELGINDDSPGLIDYLEGAEKDLSNVLIQTSIPKLKVLPAGHLHENATELLASENMKRLMQELSDRYSDRVIVFDSPPLLITTEAAVLANLVGQVVFVVASEQSSKEAVEDAIEYIGNDKIIGLLLNKVRKSPLSKIGYGYGYGYGYGQGYGYGNGYREKTRQSRAGKAQVDQQ
ncbi:polysaccharide biosynthesis tyrosine autokinase [Aestuariicella hydrocarbonica]|uniref:non-specific protein-tyrosine kinase n=2 Tax=Pseudomaricurvus hydrocarbonicus TaxID=1470433 RepID=A0A9E5JSW0_9GAMM|nr:polysaccharide biosynthesis tyrosine autokinase [Aestuariicella hydrocarbonica]